MTIDDVIHYVELIVKSEGYKKITIIAPGSRYEKSVRYLRSKYDVEAIYDKDPELPYTVGDPIFDHIEINSELIITYHGEKLYPPHLKYPNSSHIIVVKDGFHLDPTSSERMNEDDFDEVVHMEPWTIYYKV